MDLNSEPNSPRESGMPDTFEIVEDFEDAFGAMKFLNFLLSSRLPLLVVFIVFIGYKILI